MYAPYSYTHHPHDAFLFAVSYQPTQDTAQSYNLCKPIYTSNLTAQPYYTLEPRNLEFAQDSALEQCTKYAPLSSELLPAKATVYAYNPTGFFYPAPITPHLSTCPLLTYRANQESIHHHIHNRSDVTPAHESRCNTHENAPRHYWPLAHHASPNKFIGQAALCNYAVQIVYALFNPNEIMPLIEDICKNTVTIITTIGKVASWLADKIVSFWNWLTGKGKDPADFCYEKYVQNNPIKVDALEACHHFAGLLELACKGNSEEQVLARIALFQTEFPKIYAQQMKSCLTQFAKLCIDQNNCITSKPLQASDIYPLFKEFYTQVAAVSWQAYGRMNNQEAEQELVLTTTPYAPIANNATNQALANLIYARINRDIFTMHAIKEQYSTVPSIQQQYSISMHNIAEEISGQNSYAWYTQSDLVYASSTRLNQAPLADDIMLARNYIVEEFWPYIGSHEQQFLQPLYEILPTNESIFALKNVPNYYMIIAHAYAKQIIEHHPHLLSDYGIIEPFAQHPFIQKYFNTECTKNKTLLLQTNFALIVANMYQDHRTQTVSYELIRSSYNAHANNQLLLQNDELIHAQKLYKMLLNIDYQPAFYGPPAHQRQHYYRYSLHLNGAEKEALESESINPWQFENIYITNEQELLIQACKATISSYIQQTNSMCTIEPALILYCVAGANSYIQIHDYTKATCFLQTAQRIANYNKQIQTTYTQAQSLGIAQKVTSLLHTPVAEHELTIFACTQHQKELEELHAAFTQCMAYLHQETNENIQAYSTQFIHFTLKTMATDIIAVDKQSYLVHTTQQKYLAYLYRHHELAAPYTSIAQSYGPAMIVACMQYLTKKGHQLQFNVQYYTTKLSEAYHKIINSRTTTYTIPTSANALMLLAQP